jgi:hypothetical protein
MSGRNLIADAGSWPGIEDTKAGGLSGRARFLGLGSGKAKLEFYDQNLTLAKSLSLSFVGKSPIINADGRYSDSSITMITQDSEGRSKRTVKGTLTFLGITYNLEGYRYWSRMRFELFNRATGDRAGSGWTSWWPTKECLDKLRGGSIEPTDRMIFGLNPNSGGFPNGVQKVLTLAKPAKA